MGGWSGVRRSSRVLLVDERGRPLLFRALLDGGRTLWFTAGGGARDGETLEEAAVRELREETGLALGVPDLGPVVAETSGELSLAGRRVWATDSFFFVQIATHVVDTSGFEQAERRVIQEHRWWPVSEIEAASDTIVPRGLSGLLRRLLAGELPAPPGHLPWAG